MGHAQLDMQPLASQLVFIGMGPVCRRPWRCYLSSSGEGQRARSTDKRLQQPRLGAMLLSAYSKQLKPSIDLPQVGLIVLAGGSQISMNQAAHQAWRMVRNTWYGLRYTSTSDLKRSRIDIGVLPHAFLKASGYVLS